MNVVSTESDSIHIPNILTENVCKLNDPLLVHFDIFKFRAGSAWRQKDKQDNCSSWWSKWRSWSRKGSRCGDIKGVPTNTGIASGAANSMAANTHSPCGLAWRTWCGHTCSCWTRCPNEGIPPSPGWTFRQLSSAAHNPPIWNKERCL